MKKVTTSYPQKQVECEACGYITSMPKAYPLKLSCCKQCGSIKIRLYKKDLTNEKR